LVATPPAHMRAQPPRRQPLGPKAKQQRRARPAKDPTTPRSCLAANPVLEVSAGPRCPRRRCFVALGAEGRRAAHRIRQARSRFRHLPSLRCHGMILDRIAANGLHQGHRAFRLPPYQYRASRRPARGPPKKDGVPALMVGASPDNISDPRNLGAIVRSVAAVSGGNGVLISAAALGRRSPPLRGAPVLVRAARGTGGPGRRISLGHCGNWARRRPAGGFGLDAGGGHHCRRARRQQDPWSWWSVSEGQRVLSRLVRENCDAVVSIPMAGADRVV